MTLQIIGTYFVIFWLIVGSIFALVGSIGLLKFNDPMTRMHAPTKVGTVGIGAFLLASMVHSWVFHDGSIHELLIMAFLFVTAPISANFIAKVYIHNHPDADLPKPPRDDTWCTLADTDRGEEGS